MSTERLLTERPLRVLLIEDSEDDALVLERHLRRAGFSPLLFRVETAESMRQALGSNADGGGHGCWDVILSDYNLPTFSAPEALKLLEESGIDLPFIVMSGAVSEETAVAAMRAGAHDYVSKQNMARLVPAIERELGEAQARRQRFAAETALRQSEQRFHRLVEAMPAGLLICDSTGRLLYANGAVDGLLGLSPAEVLSGSINLAGILEDAADLILSSTLGSAEEIKARQYPPFETECLKRGGARVSLLVGLALLNPEAPVPERQVAAFLVDLGEQKRSQEVVRRTEKLAATGRLAASIAHEINNPLEAVTNCLYLMQQANLDKSARGYLDLAQRELDRVVHITTQTLRFYRQNTRPTEADVHELLETVLALYEARMRTFGIQYLREFGDIPRITVYDGEIRQIFANLVGNAVDAMQGSGGKLTLRTARGKNWRQESDGIVITVADTGSGMDKSTLKRLFEPFFSTKGDTGTGLGLWVSQEILIKHLGKIQVRSRQAKGSRHGWTVFRVFIPFSSQAAIRRRSDLLPAAASA
jgi:PAS domain S-box-containing protein